MNPDNAVRVFIGAFIVIGGCTNKDEIHKVFQATCGEAFCRMISRLFLYVCLFLEVIVAEWVIGKRAGCTKDVLWEDVQLMFAGGTQAKGPSL